jgi:ubiquinone/menaquinone biosynthesis C-methylase UbiE
MKTYFDFASICTTFYDLVVDPREVAAFVRDKIGSPKKVLFIGGFFSVAKELQFDLTIVDYTDAMVLEAKERLPNTRVVKADMRKLPFENEFDAVIVIGRVFTHMFTDDDVDKALQSIRKSLKSNGVLLFDNYETTKITKTNYFNGVVKVNNDKIEIIRDSTTELTSENPFIVDWKATYTVKKGQEVTTFTDAMPHRAFSREEISEFVQKNGFKLVATGDNFDETSFYALVQKS